jgi:histidine triad (HIT) family protein
MTCDTADCPGNLRTKLAWGDPPCVFCQIASGKVPAQIADEAEGWTSFPPLGPHVPGHMLFVPRRHVADATVEPALTGTVFAAASAYLGRVLRSQGNLLTSVGPDATQTVMHLHVHVIPRGAGDGLHHDWPWMRDTRISPADATAEEARDA